MNQGEEIPLLVLKVLKTLYDTENPLFEKVSTDNGLVKLISSNPGSKFYFHILEQRVNNGHTQILIEYSPQSKSSNTSRKIWLKCDHDSINSHLSLWVDLLQGFKKYDFLSDNILDQRAKEIESYFNIADEDFDLPLSLNDIPNLNRYLLDFEGSIDHSRNPKISTICDDLIAESEQVRENLSTTTKGKLAKKLSKLFAKSSKLGTTFFLKTMQHFHATITSESTKWLINGSDDLFGFLN
ncbi:hypothetical protein [Croceimicrobium hydrocarbonivorans]|uniref:Uncharacterized protein n=1 Tax=Croceimicrobium hydrocarbonivorans TaxID=2761580 RepID=A0A7H0VAM2_9FLAO|nr:hypothetical protein [Croceimicrobium hydrocarbonivorans]QNR22770.1 hypothetical protein H4K34_10290 [Croceimicrobium hydrocarbonivorans]